METITTYGSLDYCVSRGEQMSQKTVEFCGESESNVSKSKWISEVVRDKVSTEWPQSIQDLAGAWKSFPSLEEIRSDLTDAKQ